MNDRVVGLCLVVWLAVVITSSYAQQFHQNTRYGKRSGVDDGDIKPDCPEPQPVSQGRMEARSDRFFLGSRYGKRNYVHSYNVPEENWSKVNHPSLRNDRFFFIGSRYGKRDPPGEPDENPYDSNPIRLPPCPVVN